MKASARSAAALAALAVVGGGIYAVPRLLYSGAAPPAEQRLRGEPGTDEPAGGKSEAPQAAAPGKPFTLVATGDIIPYPSIVQRSAADADRAGEYDFRKILAGVKPWSPPPTWRYATTRYRTGAPAAPTRAIPPSRPRTNWRTPSRTPGTTAAPPPRTTPWTTATRASPAPWSTSTGSASPTSAPPAAPKRPRPRPCSRRAVRRSPSSPTRTARTASRFRRTSPGPSI